MRRAFLASLLTLGALAGCQRGPELVEYRFELMRMRHDPDLGRFIGTVRNPTSEPVTARICIERDSAGAVVREGLTFVDLGAGETAGFRSIGEKGVGFRGLSVDC